MTILISIFTAIFAFAGANPTTTHGDHHPVEWSFEVKEVGELTYELQLVADIDKGWYVYSQTVDDGGPVATTVTFEDMGSAEKSGDTEETGDVVKEGMDEMFDMDIKKFGGKAYFTQTIQTKVSTTIKGNVEFMCCDDKQCLAPVQVPFSFDIVVD